MSMAPGRYLKKRREAAGFSVSQVAAALAGIHERIRPLRARDFKLLEEQLDSAETDADPLTMPQAALLHRVLSFDLSTYELLLLRHAGERATDLPEPQICRVCACTWNDACATPSGPCAWTPGDPSLCTACRDRAAIAGAVAPQGEPA